MSDADIFRAYDVRGVYGKDVTEETALLIGKSFGTYIGKGKTIVVSRDTRNSGESLKKSLIEGLTSVGCNVLDIGVTTTPMMYFAVATRGLDAGVSVTASHNPPEWNGFKMTKEKGVLCSQGMGMEEIRDIFLKRSFAESEKGKVENADITEEYESFILSKVTESKKMKIVLDPGHGAACGIAESLFKKAGHDVDVINANPDGSFPSRPSDPKEENVFHLMKAVVDNDADLGIAFDGDADRVALVDNMGRYVRSGNITIPILSEYYVSKNKGAKIVHDVCCSSYVDESIKSAGGVPIASKVGHSFIMNKMIDEGAVFGGEYSNHLYFSEVFGFDDAVFAGLKIAEIIGTSGQKLSDIVDAIPVYPSSKVEEIDCDDSKKFEVVSRIGDRMRDEGYNVIDIDGVKAFDEEGNWMLIRGSNTMPVIKANTEAKSEDRMTELLDIATKVIREEIAR